jgi:hypothetical protein
MKVYELIEALSMIDESTEVTVLSAPTWDGKARIPHSIAGIGWSTKWPMTDKVLIGLGEEVFIG